MQLRAYESAIKMPSNRSIIMKSKHPEIFDYLIFKSLKAAAHEEIAEK